MIRYPLLFIYLVAANLCVGQQFFNSYSISFESREKLIHGSLMVPDTINQTPIVLIIPDTGPIDRNGNNPQMKNNALKLLAEGLYQYNISSFRYDKYGIGKSQDTAFVESALRFEHYVEDAANWIDYYKKDNRFSKVVVLGHGQGALIAKLAAIKEEPDALISVNGGGRPIDLVLRDQLEKPIESNAALGANFKAVISSFKAGKTTDNIHDFFIQVFNPSIQPFFISWMKYDPAKEIAKLSIPILVVHGNRDLQIREKDAQLLKDANPKALLLVIDKMNHIFRKVTADYSTNYSTYNQPELPIMYFFLKSVADYVKRI